MVKQFIPISFLLVTALQAQDKPPAQPQPHVNTYRLEFTITDLEGARKVQSRNYSLLVMDGRTGRQRVGIRLPIALKEEQFQYSDVGVNIDATPTSMEGQMVRLRTTVEVSALAAERGASRQPIIRQLREDVDAIIPLDKPVLLTSQDEPGTNTTFQVQVVARIQK